jgi:hypothetical protein
MLVIVIVNVNKYMKKLGLIWVGVVILLLVGEVKCIFKAVDCNWEPIGKAEIIYTGAALTGLGSIVGWMDIEDK